MAERPKKIPAEFIVKSLLEATGVVPPQIQNPSRALLTGETAVRQGVLRAVESARKHGLSTDVVEKMHAQEDFLHNQFLKGALPWQAMHMAMPARFDNRISVGTIDDFRSALQTLNISEEDTERLAHHENTHLQEALKHKHYQIKPRLEIEISIDANGHPRAHPSTQWDKPLGMSEADQRKMEIAILKAPGDDMSIHDKRAVEGLGGTSPDTHVHKENIPPRNAQEIAEELLDYETGEVNPNISENLLPDYEKLIAQVQEKAGEFEKNQPSIILSELSMAMIQNFVVHARSLGKELAFSLQGGFVVGPEGNPIYIAALAAPASTSSTASEVAIDPAKQKASAQALMRSTGFADFFESHDKSPQGLTPAVIHVHLGGENPSQADYDQGASWLERSEANPAVTSPLWGVAAQTEKGIGLKILLSHRDETGEIKHTQLPVYGVRGSELGRVS